MAKSKLSANQLAVLEMACTHGDLSQGCRSMGDHGGRLCTIVSLRRRGLLDVMNKPTDEGRRVLSADGQRGA